MSLLVSSLLLCLPTFAHVGFVSVCVQLAVVIAIIILMTMHWLPKAPPPSITPFHPSSTSPWAAWHHIHRCGFLGGCPSLPCSDVSCRRWTGTKMLQANPSGTDPIPSCHQPYPFIHFIQLLGSNLHIYIGENEYCQTGCSPCNDAYCHHVCCKVRSILLRIGSRPRAR